MSIPICDVCGTFHRPPSAADFRRGCSGPHEVRDKHGTIRRTVLGQTCGNRQVTKYRIHHDSRDPKQFRILGYCEYHANHLGVWAKSELRDCAK